MCTCPKHCFLVYSWVVAGGSKNNKNTLFEILKELIKMKYSKRKISLLVIVIVFQVLASHMWPWSPCTGKSSCSTFLLLQSILRICLADGSNLNSHKIGSLKYRKIEEENSQGKSFFLVQGWESAAQNFLWPNICGQKVMTEIQGWRKQPAL